MNLKTLPGVNVKDKTVLLRVDYNVPLAKINGRIQVTDDTRIRLSLPTIHYLLNQNCKIVLISHNGRPDGEIIDEFRLDPVATRLSQLLNVPIKKIDYCQGPQVVTAASSLKPRLSTTA